MTEGVSEDTVCGCSRGCFTKNTARDRWTCRSYFRLWCWVEIGNVGWPWIVTQRPLLHSYSLQGWQQSLVAKPPRTGWVGLYLTVNKETDGHWMVISTDSPVRNRWHCTPVHLHLRWEEKLLDQGLPHPIFNISGDRANSQLLILLPLPLEY